MERGSEFTPPEGKRVSDDFVGATFNGKWKFPRRRSKGQSIRLTYWNKAQSSGMATQLLHRRQMAEGKERSIESDQKCLKLSNLIDPPFSSSIGVMA